MRYLVHTNESEEQQVKCINCNWTGEEDALKITVDPPKDNESMTSSEACPDCNSGEYLMDI